MKQRLLINFVYWQNVGHAVEALRYALGYPNANSDLEISVVLNKHTTHSLVDLCPWISKKYLVDIPDDDIEVSKELYKDIPRDWDYIVSTDRSLKQEYCPGAFWDYYRQIDKYLTASKGKGICGDATLDYEPNQNLLIDLPINNKEYAKSKGLNTKVRIAIMFGGHKDSKYFPSLKSWDLILESLYKEYDSLSVYFHGKLVRSDKSTLTSISKKELDTLLDKYPNTVNCFDIGLFNQLAMIAGNDAFISPHTGFAFAALAVGTPWLTISGGPWAEYFYNGIPFYSVLPDQTKYPCYIRGYDENVVRDNGERVLSMSQERIKADLPEIVNASRILIDKKWSYEKCLEHHFEKMKNYYEGDISKIHSFDGIHHKYLD